MSTHWIVVANASQARIFYRARGKLQPVQTLHHPESRDAAKLNAQEEGGMASEGGKAKQRERPRFAAEVCSLVARHVRAGKVQEVTLVAPADMLHALREQAKAEPLKSSVKDTIAKDLVHHDARDIERVLLH